MPGLDPCDLGQFLGCGSRKPGSGLFGRRKDDVVTEDTASSTISAGCSMVGVVDWNSGRPQAGTHSHAWRRMRVDCGQVR